MSTMTQIDYAKHAGVDRKTVSRWIKAGKYIVLDGDLVNVEESDKAVATLRDSKDPRTKNASKKRPVKVPAADLDDSTDETIKEIMLANGVEWTREEASRVKENYLALLTKLEFEKEDGQLVELWSTATGTTTITGVSLVPAAPVNAVSIDAYLTLYQTTTSVGVELSLYSSLSGIGQLRTNASVSGATSASISNGVLEVIDVQTLYFNMASTAAGSYGIATVGYSI
ncbi:tail fiber protein [Yersinia frederiksenii]|nr:tail fiber protein [Yersinia frederiksenii]CNJ00479.1 tail fiber protein [Yersinia frederiksenii]